jgi:triosephosphate isomerase
MCEYIRNVIEELYDEEVADAVVIQYGGSVKPSNATDIMNMSNIDGALVGGASLKANDFMEIIDFYDKYSYINMADFISFISKMLVNCRKYFVFQS